MHVHVLCELSYIASLQCSRVGVTGMKLSKECGKALLGTER